MGEWADEDIDARIAGERPADEDDEDDGTPEGAAELAKAAADYDVWIQAALARSALQSDIKEAMKEERNKKRRIERRTKKP